MASIAGFDLSGYTETGLNIGIITIIIFVIVMVVAIGTWTYVRWKKYQEFECIIWERDGFGQLVQKYDQAGIFVDSATHNKRFFMKKANVGLSPDNIPYITTAGGKKKVYLYRLGLKNFYFIKPEFDDENIQLSVGEEDINWAVNAYEKQKKLFTQNLFLQYMPFILLAFVTLVILVIFIYFFKDFSVLKEMAVELRAAAEAIAQAKAGTVVLH